MTISFTNIEPDDGNALQRATRKAERVLAERVLAERVLAERVLAEKDRRAPAATALQGMTVREREQLAEAVVWVARSGYARTLDGALDEEALSQAAAARLRSVVRRR